MQLMIMKYRISSSSIVTLKYKRTSVIQLAILKYTVSKNSRDSGFEIQEAKYNTSSDCEV
jgi:hypothetical protein